MKADQKKQLKSYLELLERIQNDIQSLITEIENETTHNLHQPKIKSSLDIRFDAVPILNKLRESLKECKLSIHLTQTKLKKQ